MLSLHTNAASLSAQSAIGSSTKALGTSQTRLSTGYRVNSAMDDAAGLQIATRLKSQTSGMAVAMRNTQNGISMMQTAEGAFNEVNDMLIRMKDLATQAADGSLSAADQTAMQAEYDALANQLTQVMASTTFGGMDLLEGTTGALSKTGGVTFQIGATSAETYKLDLAATFATLQTALTATSTNYKTDGTAVTTAGTELTAAGTANTTIDKLQTAIDSVGTVRSALGAASNRLDHVYNNLGNMSNNTEAAKGRIMDTDYAKESATMISKQMQSQVGNTMLKQANSMSQMTLSLLQ